MREETLSRRYARAVLDVAKENNVLEEAAAELDFFSTLFSDKGSDFFQLMQNPVFSLQERRAVVRSICALRNTTEKVVDILDFLIEKDRFSYLELINKAFRIELDQRLGRVQALLASATPLHPEEVTRISENLSKRVGKTIIPKTVIDPSLLGGVKAQIGGLLLDGTIKGRLNSLEKSLLQSVSA